MECPGPVERGRNFRLLTNEELPRLLEFLAGYLPESLKFHQTVLTYMRNKVWEFHFYVADGWPDVPICLHFPGMTLSPQGLLYESFGVFCPTANLDQLHLLREEDILIDWDKALYINFVHHEIAEELFRLYDETGTIERVLGDVWACEEPENTEQIEEEEPIEGEPDVQVQQLCPEHAEGIHELYPANDMECHEIFLRLIRILPAAGVFVEGQLAAWMIQSYYGAMFSMQTKPEYRRKGYGTRLARYLTKTVADRGYTPFVVIRPENEASQSLYKKLGFRKLYQTVRATFTPFNSSESLEQATTQDTDLSNIIRRLNIEQRVIDALHPDEDTTVLADIDDAEGEETIRDPTDSPKDNDDEADGSGENGYVRDDECLEPIEEQPEDKTDSVGYDQCENVDTTQDVVDTDASVCDHDNGDE